MPAPSTPASAASDVALDAAPGLLRQLGFAPDEIHYGELLSDGRIAIPAVVAGESVRLLVDTTQRMDVAIELARAVKWGWPYERRDRQWGQSPLADFFALGHGRTSDVVSVEGAEDVANTFYSTAGTLGAPYFHGGTLAIDPIDAAIGWSTTLDLEASQPAGTRRVALVRDTLDDLPITLDLEDTASPGERPQLLIDTNRERSVLSLEYIERVWSSARAIRRAREACERGKRVDLYLRVPGSDEHVWIEASVFERVQVRYAEETGSKIDGYLGLDFLYQWLPVIDTRGWSLWLSPLS